MAGARCLGAAECRGQPGGAFCETIRPSWSARRRSGGRPSPDRPDRRCQSAAIAATAPAAANPASTPQIRVAGRPLRSGGAGPSTAPPAGCPPAGTVIIGLVVAIAAGGGPSGADPRPAVPLLGRVSSGLGHVGHRLGQRRHRIHHPEAEHRVRPGGPWSSAVTTSRFTTSAAGRSGQRLRISAAVAATKAEEAVPCTARYPRQPGAPVTTDGGEYRRPGQRRCQPAGCCSDHTTPATATTRPRAGYHTRSRPRR